MSNPFSTAPFGSIPFGGAQFASASKAQFDGLLTLANTTLAGIERLTSLNLNMARSVFEDTAGSASALLAAKDFQDFVAIQATLSQPATDKLAQWSQGVYAIGSETREALSQTLDTQLTEAGQTMTSALDELIKHAPPGTDAAVNASVDVLKSALGTASAACATLNKTARQMDEYAANLSANTKPKPAKSKKA
ncbi:MAG: phasin family protein [Rhodocyclaceae bacterium]|nr:phasin family protein [Rhodocyclaceae bacterium]